MKEKKAPAINRGLGEFLSSTGEKKCNPSQPQSQTILPSGWPAHRFGEAAMTMTDHVSRYGARTVHVPTRLESWQPFYEMREAGCIPRESWVRVALSPGLTLGAALDVPEEANPWDLDFSPVAALDTFVIYDADQTSYGRLRNAVGAILRADPACLYLLDAPPGYEPRWACIKRGYPRGGYINGQ